MVYFKHQSWKFWGHVASNFSNRDCRYNFSLNVVEKFFSLQSLLLPKKLTQNFLPVFGLIVQLQFAKIIKFFRIVLIKYRSVCFLRGKILYFFCLFVCSMLKSFHNLHVLSKMHSLNFHCTFIKYFLMKNHLT